MSDNDKRFLKGTECPKGLICFPKLEPGQVDKEGRSLGTQLCMAWPKDEAHKAWNKKLQDLAKAAGAERFGPKQKFKSPVKDADTYEGEDGEMFADKFPELAGHFFINLSSHKAFSLVGPNPRVEMTHEEVTSGDIGRAAIHAYAWEFSDNNVVKKGVSFGHGNVQKLEDGPVQIGGSGGAGKPEDDFDDDISSEAATKSADAAVDGSDAAEPADDEGWGD